MVIPQRRVREVIEVEEDPHAALDPLAERDVDLRVLVIVRRIVETFTVERYLDNGFDRGSGVGGPNWLKKEVASGNRTSFFARSWTRTSRVPTALA